MKVRISGGILHTLQYGIRWFQDYVSVLVQCPDYRGSTLSDYVHICSINCLPGVHYMKNVAFYHSRLG